MRMRIKRIWDCNYYTIVYKIRTGYCYKREALEVTDFDYIG